MSLARKTKAEIGARIWAVSYDDKKNAFRVAMENGEIMLLQRPIPEDDLSEVLEVYIEGDGEVFTVVQASGNEFSVPWDVAQSLATGKARDQNTEIGKRIGKRVKAYRKQRGLTQDQLAKMAKVKRPNISRLEAGKHTPGIIFIQRLADCLQVRISDLIADRINFKGF
jgi:DNA-binding XRE family transcriptional regulator